MKEVRKYFWKREDDILLKNLVKYKYWRNEGSTEPILGTKSVKLYSFEKMANLSRLNNVAKDGSIT